MPTIPYVSERFPTGSIANGPAILQTSWDEILWAALTVGRPNRYHVFRHGEASFHEALFRLSLVRMAVQDSQAPTARLVRTQAAQTLDPTEKGAVSYFLGMTFCQVFAARLLDTPWMLHLDVFRPALDVVLSGRSRPDLIAQEGGCAMRWHAFECKGRISQPDEEAKKKAKAQAQRVVSVDGGPCSLHIGAITYFRDEELNFYWRDPDPDPEPGQEVALELPRDVWAYHYSPILGLLREAGPPALATAGGALLFVEEADLQVAVHPAVAGSLANARWDQARDAAIEASSELRDEGYQADGLRVVAGDSWSMPFEAWAEAR